MGLHDHWCLCICRTCKAKGAHYDDFCGEHAAVSFYGPELKDAATRRGWLKGDA